MPGGTKWWVCEDQSRSVIEVWFFFLPRKSMTSQVPPVWSRDLFRGEIFTTLEELRPGAAYRSWNRGSNEPWTLLSTPHLPEISWVNRLVRPSLIRYSWSEDQYFSNQGLIWYGKKVDETNSSNSSTPKSGVSYTELNCDAGDGVCTGNLCRFGDLYGGIWKTSPPSEGIFV